MNIRMKILKVALLAGLVSGLFGCAAISSTNNGSKDVQTSVAPADTSIAESSPISKDTDLTSDFSRSKLIAADFVATIAQIPATAPSVITLFADEPTTRFGELLLGSLQQAGFDLRIGSQSADSMLVYNAIRDEQPSASGNPVYTFIIAAGEVKLKRSYEVDQYGVQPTGGMFVRGASVKNVRSNDDMFNSRQTEPTPEQPLPVPENQPDTPTNRPVPGERKTKPEYNPAPTIAELEQDKPSELYVEKNDEEWTYEKSGLTAEQLRMEHARELEESIAALAPARDLANRGEFTNSDAYAEVPNMFETGQSRYQDIFNNYDVVDTSVLVFPNDSLIMGKDNKTVIRQFANSFDSETDVMSVIGCSHGASKLENGNAYLANGRAFRVKEEFLSIGLSPKHVLEEGCWAEVAFPDMPARGVLVQHKRLTNSQ